MKMKGDRLFKTGVILKNFIFLVLMSSSLMLYGQSSDSKSSTTSSGEHFKSSISKIENDIKSSVEELNLQRDTFEKERKPLFTHLDGLQNEVRDLRLKMKRLNMSQNQKLEEQKILSDSVKSLDEEYQFIYTILSEYRRSLETRTNVAEAEYLKADLKTIDDLLLRRDSHSQLPKMTKSIFDLTESFNSQKKGGMIFEGTALDEMGVEHNGAFAVLGPAAYFAEKNGELSGLVISQPGSVSPSVYQGFINKTAVHTLIEDKEGAVPLDVTEGDAIKVADANYSIWEHIKKGGFVMFPLMGIGIIAFVLAVWKFIDIRKMNAYSRSSVTKIVEHIKENNIGEAKEMARNMGMPVSDVILEGIEHRSASKENLEEMMHEQILVHVPMLERHLGTLAVFGGVAPLLGLLGTVTGMIHTFQLVTIFGTGDAKLLSGGISEALITTEFGLIIAIPVLLVHAYLSRGVRMIITSLECTAAGFVNKLLS